MGVKGQRCHGILDDRCVVVDISWSYWRFQEPIMGLADRQLSTGAIELRSEE